MNNQVNSLKDKLNGLQNIESSYDVVIVGSGPAGAGTAKALTGSGLKTLLIERAIFKRDKICSGIVFPSGCKIITDDFGELPESVFCSPKEVLGNRLFLKNDSDVLEIPLSAVDPGEGLPEYGWNTHRSELDLWLCQQSDATLVEDCLFVDCLMEQDSILARVRHQNRQLNIKTKFLVGADGLRSRVRRSIFPDEEKSIGWLPVYEEWYEGSIDLEPGFLYYFLDRSLTDAFATVFHKDERILVTTTVDQARSSKECFKLLRDLLERKHGLRVKRTGGSCGIIKNDMTGMKNYRYGKGNVLIAGEANGVIESIHTSLNTGKAAGQAILESMRTGRPAFDCFVENEILIAEREKGEMIQAGLIANLGMNLWLRTD